MSVTEFVFQVKTEFSTLPCVNRELLDLASELQLLALPPLLRSSLQTTYFQHLIRFVHLACPNEYTKSQKKTLTLFTDLDSIVLCYPMLCVTVTDLCIIANLWERGLHPKMLFVTDLIHTWGTLL